MQISTSTVGKERAATRSAPPVWPLRWRVARQIAGQELRDALFGWSFYLTAAIGPFLSALFVYNSLNFVAMSGLLILARPFYVPVLMTTTLAALTNLPFPPLLLVGLLVSPVFAAVAVAIGLCISTIATSSRSAMFFFGATLLVVLAIPIGYTALLKVPPTSRYYDALLFLRGLMQTLRDLLNWISPYALLSAGADAATRASWGDLIQRLVVGVAGGVVWAGLAIWGLQRRGVLP